MAVVFSGGSPVSVHRTSPLTTSGAGSLSLYTGSVQTYAELYRRQPNLRLVIRFLGRNVAQLPLHGFERVSDTDRRRITDGQLCAWLDAPDRLATIPLTRHEWIRNLIEDLKLYDSFLAVKIRPDGSDALSTVRIPPTHFQVIGDSWLWPDGFRVFGNTGYKDFGPGEVIYLHGHNPDDPRSGCAPAEALRRVLAEDYAAGQYREQMWNNAGRMSGIITRPSVQQGTPEWSDESRERFLRDFAATYSGIGAGAGKTPVLEEGMKFEAHAFSAKEAEYLGARRLTREECAAQYFIPPVFVGILENANYANIKEQHRGLYSDTLGPDLDWIEGALKMQLLPDLEAPARTYFEFRLEEKLRGSFEEQMAALQTAIGRPWLLASEGRSMMNLPEVEGFDQPITPLNVLVGGQASPTDSAPPPAGQLGRGPDPRRAYAALAIAAKAEGDDALAYSPEWWEAKYLERLTRFFTRQREAVLAKLGAGHELSVAFDSERWNGELGADLLAIALGQAEVAGGALAEQYGADFDLSLLEGWLGESARIASEGINSTTLVALEEAYSGVPRTASRPSAAKRAVDQALLDAGLIDEIEDEPIDELGANVEPARSVFEVAIAARAVQIATSRTTVVGSFTRTEAAGQAGLRTKTWIASGAANSRHGALDGETVAIGETFSNGGLWPGDPALGVDETAGCKCSIEFGT